MNTTIEAPLKERIYENLVKTVGLPLHNDQRELIVAPNEERKVDAYQPIWLVDDKVIVRANPAYVERIHAAISETNLAAESIISAFENDGHEVFQMMLYALVEQHFTPVKSHSRYSVRQLSQDDTKAFAAFQAACSDEDREEGDVGLDHEIIFGVLDNERIVAAASTYEMWDMIDIGVLTHPDYRKQGLGKAVVSAVCQHYLQRTDDDRIVLYRHATINQGSNGIAHGLNYQLFATTIYVKFEK